MSELTSQPMTTNATPGDRRSKLLDGVLASILFLLAVVALIALTIFMKRVGPVALFVEGVVMTAVAIYLLQRSYASHLAEVTRAWLGVLGGFFGWTALEASALLGQLAIETEQGVWLFVLAGLVTAVLFRNSLPLGPKFWLAAFHANWVGHIILFTQRALALNGYPIFETTYKLSGVIAGIGIVGVYTWIFTRSRTRIQRLWAALTIFVLIIIVVYAIRGFW